MNVWCLPKSRYGIIYKININYKGDILKENKIPSYTIGEEIFNSVSHGVGALFAIAALAILVVISVNMQDSTRLACAITYGGSMIMLYTMSTLYHALRGKAKLVFRVFDHCSVYLLIAGSYVPFMMITLKGTMGYILMAAIGIISIIAIILNIISIERFKTFSHIAYVALGWSIVLAIKPLFAALPTPGIMLLVGGGLSYTLGLIFYALNSRFKYMHSIWHLFVLAGSVTQFLCIVYYVFL